jgi:hypothetical protein
MIFTVSAENNESGLPPGSEYELILKEGGRFKIKALHVSGQGGPDTGSYTYSARHNAATLTYEIKIPKALRKQLKPTLHTVSLVFSTSTQGTYVNSAGKHTSDSGTFTD